MYLTRYFPRWNRSGEADSTGSGVVRFHADVDRLFDDFLRSPLKIDSWFTPVIGAGVRWTPTLDISETDKEITVRAEIPGVDKNELDISIADDVLTISGEKKEETEEEDGKFYRTERRFGSFRRSVALPASVNSEKVKAEYEAGVVTVRLPKAEETATRRIPVEAAKN